METRSAATRAVVLCYFLWSLFYFQFLLKFVTGVPYLGLAPRWGLMPYERIEGYFFTLAELLLGVSITAGVVSVITVIQFTPASRAKWRLRFMVALFCVFPIGMAWLHYPAKKYHIDHAKRSLENLQRERERFPEMPEFYEQQIRDLEVLLERVRD